MNFSAIDLQIYGSLYPQIPIFLERMCKRSKTTYYVGRAYRNQTVRVRLNAHDKTIHLEIGDETIKTMPLKGLYGRPLAYLDFLGLMCDEARSEWKQYLWRQHLKTIRKSS